MINRLFRAHLRDAGESYGEHFRVATGVGAAMALGALACFVHALVPGIFRRTGSGTIDRLHRRIHARAKNGDERSGDER